jgi:hypothetical protein
MNQQCVPPYRYGRGPTNLPTPEETPPGKTGGCGRDAWGHAMPWGYQRVRQPLVIPHCSHPEEERRPALLHRLQKTNSCHKEGLSPTAPDWQQSGHAGCSQMVSTIDLMSGY